MAGRCEAAGLKARTAAGGRQSVRGPAGRSDRQAGGESDEEHDDDPQRGTQHHGYENNQRREDGLLEEAEIVDRPHERLPADPFADSIEVLPHSRTPSGRSRPVRASSLHVDATAPVASRLSGPAGRATKPSGRRRCRGPRGRSEKATARRLGLSHSTVKHHLANARSKVGATTTAQLVWILAARLPGPDGEAVLSRAIDSMGAEREDGIL